eukprot:TRINITY_DN74306_c0_g1_i1.p2 TRINITY_DN74306_c0_g1~~TRINITY_DN74306_c0_g1_i1.p2  ORF type:complete len:310 (-),score=70.20 TRINITY_DN74306_c0_g1_i1:60-869(-)
MGDDELQGLLANLGLSGMSGQPASEKRAMPGNTGFALLDAEPSSQQESPAQVTAPADANAAVQLQILKLLERLTQGSTDQPLLGVELGQGKASATISRYHRLRAAMKTQPMKAVRTYVSEVKARLGAQDGQPWTFADDNRRLGWGRHQTLRRCHLMMGEVLKYILQGQPQVAAAQAVACLRSLHQCCLDQGNWKAAWLLCYIEDGAYNRRFGGTEAELEAISSYVKMTDELAAKIRGNPSQKSEEDEEEADAEGTDSKKAKAKGKGRPK